MKKGGLKWIFLALGCCALMAASCPNSDEPDAGPASDSGHHDGGAGVDHAGPSNGKFCQEQCGQTTDCLSNFECQSSNRCIYTGDRPDPCTSNESCHLTMSGSTACTTSANCTGRICVHYGGGTYCAVQPNQYVSCTQMTMAEVTVTDVDNASVTVCLNTAYECNTGTGNCWNPCTDNNECSGLTPHCNTTTRLCECVASPSDSCATSGNGGHACVDGTCGCRVDEDCNGAGFTKCYDGWCGCASVADCTAQRAHPGTTWVCATLP
jgi:hypothetical protein